MFGQHITRRDDFDLQVTVTWSCPLAERLSVFELAAALAPQVRDERLSVKASVEFGAGLILTGYELDHLLKYVCIRNGVKVHLLFQNVHVDV